MNTPAQRCEHDWRSSVDGLLIKCERCGAKNYADDMPASQPASPEPRNEILYEQSAEADVRGLEIDHLRAQLEEARKEVERLHAKYDWQTLVIQNDRYLEALNRIANQRPHAGAAGEMKAIAKEALAKAGDGK